MRSGADLTGLQHLEITARSAHPAAMSSGRNPYSSALGLEDLDLPVLIASGKLNGRSAIMAALVEHGAPLSVEDIARRVHDLGMGESKAQLLRSLRKAWGGSQALRKLKDGRLSLDVNAPDAQFLRTQVSLITQEPSAPDPAPRRRPDAQELTEAELREALRGAYLHPLSGAMLAAIVTEATGQSMDAAEINAYVANLTEEFKPIGDPRKGTAGSPLIDLDENDRLRVNPHAPGLQALRARVRRIGEQASLARATEARARALLERMEKERLVARTEVLARRRRLLHTHDVGGSPILVGHVDPVGRHAAAFADPPSSGNTAWLPDCDILIGLEIFELVDRLGIDPGNRRLVDLRPPQKTKSLGPRRPPLKLSTDRLLRHTLGFWARLTSKSKVQQLARRRDHGELHRTMEADLDTLATYYWYGVRNGFLYANWDDYDMQVPAPFAESGDARMAEIMKDLVGHEVWMRLRAERMSDPPEDLTGVITHASWLSFTLETAVFKLQGPLTAVLGVERLSDPSG